MARSDLFDHRVPLALLGLVDLIVAVVADHRHVGRHLHDRQLVDLHELGRLGQRRSGHARELVVEAEEVLVGDRGERLILLLDRHALLRLDRLVQPLRPAPTVENASGELVDDLDLAVDHRVVDVALVQRLGSQRLIEVVDHVAVLGAIEVVDAEEALGLGDALLGDRDRLVLLVELVVEVGDELLLGARVHALGRLAGCQFGREARELDVQVGRLFGRTGDDQRRSRLVDQDVVDLVDDRERVAALDLFAQVRGHVVAQVVKAELGVGAVNDVAGVGLVLLIERLLVLQHADGHAERLIDRGHPFRISARQVVVDGHQVYALGLQAVLALARLAHGQRVEHDRKRRRKRLALAGLHLGDLAVVQRHRADHLHVEVAHAHLALACLAHDGEALGQQRVQRLAVARALAQRVHALAQFGLGVVFELGLEGVDQRDALLVLLVLLRLADVQRAIEQGGHLPRIAPGGPVAVGRPAARSISRS